ncbi:MAG TPA: type II secretion system F family protein [Polyangiaceae bacterium]|nr:type II secretion system F family protein [Polyangiaceae bacterium]
MSVPLVLSSVCLILGGLLAVYGHLYRRPSLASRLARADGALTSSLERARLSVELPAWLASLHGSYEQLLRQAGGSKTLGRLLGEKAMLAVAVPVVPLLPYAAATGRLPSAGVLLLFAVAGFLAPDLWLRNEAKRRREAIFLDLPEAVSVLALALGAGQSLRQALELAARDCPGPLGEELAGALSLARRERNLNDREALVRVARATGEPSFARFSELLAAKESPYLEFLRQQAAQMRAEQSRYLERAADRAYLAMHAPVAPLLAVLVLLLAYGFLRFLAQTV